jgi:hypothetical protein
MVGKREGKIPLGRLRSRWEEWILGRLAGELLSGFNWIRIEAIGGPL